MSYLRRKRVLFVAYAFPPAGGVGVQRVTKFVKFLPSLGWDCSVLTVANPSVPLVDDSTQSDIPPATIIRRAKTLEPGYAVKRAVSASSAGSSDTRGLKSLAKGFLRGLGNTLLQPDAQVLWHPAASRAGRRLLHEIPHDVIVATGPPFSSLLLGARLARKAGLPLVLDYRDEWGISNAYWENKRQGRLIRCWQQHQQRRAVRAARVVLATTPASAAALESVVREAGAHARAACIYNGFDADDFPQVVRDGTLRIDYGNGRSRYRLAFVGTLWNLNPIGPFLAGIERLSATAPHLLADLELVFAGRRTAEQEALLDRLTGHPCAVVRLPFVSHREACELMSTSDGLLLINADLPETNRIINAKTFEYMAARRPLFVVAPRGDLTDIVAPLPGTALCDPARPEQIAERLALVLEQHRLGVTTDGAHWDIAQFERRHQARQFAALLDSLLPDSSPDNSLAAASPNCAENVRDVRDVE